ncbi:MAG: phosphoribosylaminoimidazolesuccinocarboxamide synthase [Polyangiales bacterium]
MVDDATLTLALQHPLDGVELTGGGVYRGKVRDNLSLGDGRRVLVTTDRISAFDRVLGTIPFKGQVLSTLAAWWFERTREVAPNHFLAAPDPNVIVGVDCDPLPVEVVVRAYLTGVTSTSVWTAYARGERRFCGHALPDGLEKNDPLPEAIVTPSTKAPKGGHDVSVSADELVARGVISAGEMRAVSERALALFAEGSRRCAARGLILVDTKYEFGRAPSGEILVIDEVHTPDSSRFWFADSYAERRARGAEPQSLDKEYVRRWLAERDYAGEGPAPELPAEVRLEAARRYIDAFERITGEPFVPDTRPPRPRIAAAIDALRPKTEDR